jgi:hypothetical protein
MTKEAAKELAAEKLSAGDYIFGWNPGTEQAGFQLWVPEKGLVIEIPHDKKRPTGRRAAIMVQKAKHAR